MTNLSVLTADWPRGPSTWLDGRTLCVSIPFTWNLPEVRHDIEQGGLLWDNVLVGGPATQLMPGYFADLTYVRVGVDSPGVLQRVNAWATRTTTGCPNRCGFCGIGRGLIEPGGLCELEDWPDLPILCDNNILAASPAHFDRVMDRLERWGWCDFNQGLDARLLNDHHAERIARVHRPLCRLALDAMSVADAWENAFSLLRRFKVAKKYIRSLILIGYNDTPDDAWRRCLWVEKHGVMPSPMWFHPLDALAWNAVTERQKELGWSREERTRIMGYFYKRRGSIPANIATPAPAQPRPASM